MKKFNFRKISALAGSLLLTGMTLGTAVAANYPAPFVSGGSANVAIVYGTGAGMSQLDIIQAGNIQTDLQAYVGTSSSASSSSVTGGDSFKFEKASTKYHLGDTITTVVSSTIDDDELPTLLADGKYIDNDNDEIDYTQSITMGALQLTMFEDNDYAEDQPTVGFKVSSGTTVMTYTLTFTDALLIGDTPTTDLPIMGKTYYVLSNSTSGSNVVLTLLDSGDSATVTEGETVTVEGKDVSISFISSTEVKLTIDGETTNSLAEGNTQKLSDGSYVGIKDILFNSKDTGISSVEFSIGSGKLTLTSGAEIQMNDQAISGVTATITNSTDTLSSIAIAWAADEDLFITEESEIEMPGFEVVKLSYGGLNYPAEEMITVQQGGDLYATLEDFPLKDGPADINFLYATTSGTFSGIGKDANNKLKTAAPGSNISFDADDDDYFIASWSDGTDAESYLMRATNFVLDGSNNETDIQYYKNGAWEIAKAGVKTGDSVSLGNVDLLINSTVDRTGKVVVIGVGNSNTNFSTLYSAEGMKVYLPFETTNETMVTGASGAVNFTASTAGGSLGLGHNGTSFFLVMREEDLNGNLGAGDWINVTIGWDASTTPEVQVSGVNSSNPDATSTEIGDTDVWRDFTYSALATEILYSQPTSGQDSVKLIYHGDEVAADVYITSPDAVVTPGEGGTPGSQLGDVLVTDAEVNSVATKNLIVVGGSCINSAAASLIGSAACGAAWTEATGAGSGQFVIKGYADSTITSRLALLVAGTDAADTVNAATYLRNQKPDTSKEYLGTSATSAELVVE